MDAILHTQLDNRKDSWNASYVLFAEDLVGYIISSSKLPFKMPLILENCAQFYSNPFNDSIKNAINCILFYPHRKNRYSFEYLTKASKTIDNKYIQCAQKLEDGYFSKGFTLTNFLYYCVDIAIMSAAFLKVGMKKAPKLAVLCIVNALECHDRRKYFTKLDLITEEFPGVSKSSLSKVVDRIRDDLASFQSPLKEISQDVI